MAEQHAEIAELRCGPRLERKILFGHLCDFFRQVLFDCGVSALQARRETDLPSRRCLSECRTCCTPHHDHKKTALHRYAPQKCDQETDANSIMAGAGP